MIALLSVSEFFLILNKVVNGMNQPFEVFAGFQVSWYGILIWTTVSVMLMSFVVAMIGGRE